MHDNVQMVAHNRPSVNSTCKNVAERQNARFDPKFSVLEAFAEVFIEAAQPRSAHTAVDAVKSARLGWVNKLAAGRGHGRSLGARALRENRIGRSLGSDLSEGGCPRRALSDAASGLIYMQQRYYDPMIGRFLSTDPDPVGELGLKRSGKSGYRHH